MSFMWRWWTMAFVLGAVCLLVGTTASPAAAEAVATPAPGPVVVVGVPDLRWQDVNPTDTPALWQLAGASSIAALTDRSAAGDARRATGWVTLNTGSRALAHVPPGAVPDPGVPEQLDALRASNRASSYGAEVGALGDEIGRAHV